LYVVILKSSNNTILMYSDRCSVDFYLVVSNTLYRW